MDATDRLIVNELQGGFPVADRPFAEAATLLGIDEDDLIERVKRLCDHGTLSRFGPLYNAERLGGAVTLAALKVPAADFQRIAAAVNAHPEVAHNYAREDDLNMWFVIATETPERIAEVIADIEAETGLRIYDMPKIEEFYVGLRFQL
ncbi:MAG: Lrp/AsnC family transcriptional regulator [Rhodospirillales bacterium]|nr:Lrp/AsnC family transcriptional regulator [Rhodospirillales bacterium]